MSNTKIDYIDTHTFDITIAIVLGWRIALVILIFLYMFISDLGMVASNAVEISIKAISNHHLTGIIATQICTGERK